MFTGKEKAFVATGNVLLPLTVLVGAGLAWLGLGEMPEPIQIRDAIVYFLWSIGIAYGVFQVPNSGTITITEEEIKSLTEEKVSE